MRPRRSTWVASITSIPAPEFASMPRWVRCQSVATPSAALYWHIGATTMRFGSSRSASRMGENRALVMAAHGRWGSDEGRGTDDLTLGQIPCGNLWITGQRRLFLYP